FSFQGTPLIASRNLAFVLPRSRAATRFILSLLIHLVNTFFEIFLFASLKTIIAKRTRFSIKGDQMIVNTFFIDIFLPYPSNK
ncbi:hypothetical protein, partial [Polycladomyces subterraneus]